MPSKATKAIAFHQDRLKQERQAKIDAVGFARIEARRRSPHQIRANPSAP
jgi:hypothetical protein